MAERRMISKTIIDSDAFLDMPLSTQALYFHLNLRADDDGFVNNPRRIAKLISASDDDMKILLAKNFVIIFESGVIVIKHWRIHNTIQKDRYKPTAYTEEKNMLEIKQNNGYKLLINSQLHNDGYTLDTNCIQRVSKVETQVSLDKVSLDKVSLDKVRSDKNSVRAMFNEAYPKNGSCVDPEVDKLLAECIAKDGEQAVIEGAAAYRRYCEWKYESQFVSYIRKAKNFLGDYDYLTDWDAKLKADKKQAQKDGRAEVDDSDLSEILNWRPENES